MQCTCGDLRKHSDHCGCCGNPILDGYNEWCTLCSQHVLPSQPKLAPWDRTYFAQHKTDCPYEE